MGSKRKFPAGNVASETENSTNREWALCPLLSKNRILTHHATTWLCSLTVFVDDFALLGGVSYAIYTLTASPFHNYPNKDPALFAEPRQWIHGSKGNRPHSTTTVATFVPPPGAL